MHRRLTLDRRSRCAVSYGQLGFMGCGFAGEVEEAAADAGGVDGCSDGEGSFGGLINEYRYAA